MAPAFRLGILANIVVLTVNTTVSFLVEWVLFYYNASTGYWPIPIPVELGLVRCYGDTCKLQKISKDIPKPPKGQAQWGPPGAADSGAGIGGGSDSLGGLPGPSSPAFPFVVASVAAVVLICLACLLALAAVVDEAGRSRGKVPAQSRRPFSLLVWSSACALLAPLLYMAITAAALNGGEYKAGVWVALGLGGGSCVLSFVTWLLTDEGYITIPAVTARPMAPGLKGMGAV